MRAALLVVALGLAGCGTFSMSAEQIKASAAAKDANVVCVQGVGPWGKANTVYLNVDKGVIASGMVSIDGECKVQFSNGAKP